MPDENGRVSTRDFIGTQFSALEHLIDERFDSQDKLLTEKLKPLSDHEDRIRVLEKREPWRTVTEIVTGIMAVSGNFFGFRQ